jgi:RimJ/RimL family protein N-acetyltransferase
MPFDLQPTIQNERVRIEPLAPRDLEPLYAVASDRLIWEQHPNKERYKREVFEKYFKGAIESGGAVRVIDATNDELFGCSRYYDYDPQRSQVSIGYTFIARSRWGRNYNRALKTLMLEHAFKQVGRVVFEVGVNNLRSRRAMEKLGGVFAGEQSVAYVGEAASPNAIYHIDAIDWAKTKA